MSIPHSSTEMINKRPFVTCLLLALIAVSSFAVKSDTGYISPRRSFIPSIFDFVVVGSGPGGSTVASRLSENGRFNVLLLERGSDMSNYEFLQAPLEWVNTTGSVADAPTQIQLHNEPVVTWNEAKGRVPQGIGLGGTSLINTMMFVRGNSYDYDRWANYYGASGWNYTEVLPYFIKLENNPAKYALNPAYHGVGGPLNVSQGTQFPPQNQPFVNGAVAYGFPFNPDYNGAQQLLSPKGTVAYFDLSVANGERQSAYNSYIRPHLSRPNLWIVDSARVTKVNFDSNKRAVSVTWFDAINGVMATSFATREIILSAGAVHTAQILQLSGVGNATQLEALGINVVANSPGVGQNYMDHMITNLGVAGISLGVADPPNAGPADYQEWLQNRSGAYSSIGGNIVMFMRTKYQVAANDPRPDIQFISTTPASSIFGAIYLLRPKSRGNVLITTRDPFVEPKPLGNYLTEYQDILIACEGLRILYGVFNEIAPSGPYVYLGPSGINMTSSGQCESYLVGQEPWTVGTSNTGAHWTGTARMGSRSDPMAVIDSRLRVKGVTGLRVADASVFPEIPSGNTQAPTYMVGEKAADMIKQDNL